MNRLKNVPECRLVITLVPEVFLEIFLRFFCLSSPLRGSLSLSRKISRKTSGTMVVSNWLHGSSSSDIVVEAARGIGIWSRSGGPSSLNFASLYWT